MTLRALLAARRPLSRRCTSKPSEWPLSASQCWRISIWMEVLFVPVLDELTAIQANAIRATAAAHDRDPEELALELMHLLVAEKTPEAIDASPAICALTTDHDDTVRFLRHRVQDRFDEQAVMPVRAGDQDVER